MMITFPLTQCATMLAIDPKTVRKSAAASQPPVVRPSQGCASEVPELGARAAVGQHA